MKLQLIYSIIVSHSFDTIRTENFCHTRCNFLAESISSGSWQNEQMLGYFIHQNKLVYITIISPHYIGINVFILDKFLYQNLPYPHSGRCTDLQGTMKCFIEFHSNNIRVYRSIESCIEYYLTTLAIYGYLQILAAILFSHLIFTTTPCYVLKIKQVKWSPCSHFWGSG